MVGEWFLTAFFEEVLGVDVLFDPVGVLEMGRAWEDG